MHPTTQAGADTGRGAMHTTQVGADTGRGSMHPTTQVGGGHRQKGNATNTGMGRVELFVTATGQGNAFSSSGGRAKLPAAAVAYRDNVHCTEQQQHKRTAS